MRKDRASRRKSEVGGPMLGCRHCEEVRRSNLTRMGLPRSARNDETYKTSFFKVISFESPNHDLKPIFRLLTQNFPSRNSNHAYRQAGLGPRTSDPCLTAGRQNVPKVSYLRPLLYKHLTFKRLTEINSSHEKCVSEYKK